MEKLQIAGGDREVLVWRFPDQVTVADVVLHARLLKVMLALPENGALSVTANAVRSRPMHERYADYFPIGAAVDLSYCDTDVPVLEVL